MTTHTPWTQITTPIHPKSNQIDYRYTGEGGHGTVCLGTEYPSKIMKLNLGDYGGSLICQKGAFMAANSTVGIEMEMARSLKAGFFGGEGFVLQVGLRCGG